MSEQFETPQEVPAAEEITSDDKLWALLAYVFAPLVSIIIMLMEDKKNRPFIRKHSAQALILGIVGIVLAIVSGITIVLACLPLFWWIYLIYLGIKAYQGKDFDIPLVTDFVKNQGWA
ncbi:MAG TPA: DUF4870 domain-containing protein [Chloroflexi bacterium]|nr:DUF4870 domain-containing protein [Chloroflexota bacterium]